MSKTTLIKFAVIFGMSLLFTACNVPASLQKTENKSVPAAFGVSADTTNTSKVIWKQFFKDPFLNALIDSALQKNQELNIALQEINIAKNEVRGRKGAYLPFVTAGAGVSVEKVGRYTSRGASDDSNEIMPGKSFPDPLPDYFLGLNMSWEV
ncbi:MAG: TolC family protein, partial [Crocinitomicaceae bacterium]|nr:TolC family protein [Crocinitomicaceae bacterium]